MLNHACPDPPVCGGLTAGSGVYGGGHDLRGGARSGRPERTGAATLTALLLPGERLAGLQVAQPQPTQGERSEGWAAGTRFLLGGTGVLNSRAFLRDLLEVGANERIAGA